MTTDQAERTEKRGASFRVPRSAVDRLIAHKATAYQIGAYLTLARFTDRSGIFSTAGYKAIHNALGVSAGTKGMAARLVDELVRMRLIWDADNMDAAAWGAVGGEPEAPHERARVRWLLQTAEEGEEGWIWFGSGLVDGHGKFRQPLRRLKQCGDVAARALLIMYAENDMEQYGGVNPCRTVYQDYTMRPIKAAHGFTFWTATGVETEERRIGLRGCFDTMLPAVGTGEDSDDLADAVSALDAAGFIYEIVTVMDRPPAEKDARPIYELRARSRHGHVPKGEGGDRGLVKDIDEVLKAVHDGFSTADALGRYRGMYPAITRMGSKAHVVGIYRLRFRVANPRNDTVSRTWARIHAERKEVAGWLRQIKDSAGIT